MRGAAVSAGAAVPDGMVGAAVPAGLEWADATVVASAVDRVAGIQAADIRAVDTGAEDMEAEDMEVGDTGAEDMGVAAATVITSASSRPPAFLRCWGHLATGAMVPPTLTFCRVRSTQPHLLPARFDGYPARL
jgi:hypothetical protein